MAGNKKQYWAMRRRLEKEGKWYGDKAPAHAVPALEEGEPPSKAPRVDESPEGDRASDPEEGTSKKAQGNFNYFYTPVDWVWRHSELQLDSACWYGWIPRHQSGKDWIKINALTRKRKCSRMPLLFWEPDGEWISPLMKIAGCCTHSVSVHVLMWGLRQLFGL